MKRTGIALLSTAALLAASGAMAASADDISWTFVDAGWVNADGSGDGGTDGWALAGSLGLAEHFHIQAGFSDLSDDSEGIDVDSDTWNIGVGYHADLTPQAQWFIGVGYFDGNSDGGEGDDFDTDGFSINSGVRYRASDAIELGGQLVYADGESDDFGDFNDTSVGLYGQYYIVPAWSVGLRASLSGGGGGLTAASGDSLTIYTRYDFGNLFD